MLLNQNYLRLYLEHHNNPSKGSKTPYFTFQVSLKLNNKKRKDYLLILLCIMVKECYLIAFRLSSELKQIVLKRLKFTLFQVKLQTLKNHSERVQVNKSIALIRIVRCIYNFFLNSFFLCKIYKDFNKAKERELFFLYP